ncbi:V-type proton ATPase subunit e 2 [Trachymyrmex zeteki]|uniref:V-type proton ATPase subunit e 2 n=1 Tax=Mycetomoellerius zeteki TaxID=64791 RepID=A0A151X5L0_9HYME|nr:V-type proton ATPase subunit e 2 [Trachymyrmex zeteki]
MGASAIPVIAFTLLWGAVVFLGVALPLFVPKGPNRILQVLLVLTGFTCWLFWLCCYMAQMNPLIGPKLNSKIILVMAREWVSQKHRLDRRLDNSYCIWTD